MPARTERESRFHPTIKLKYGERSIQAAKDAGSITADDEERIREYIIEKEGTKHISEGRQLKITYTLIKWRNYLPRPYNELTFKDVLLGIKNLNNAKFKKADGKEYPISKNTKHDYSRILKAFLLWLIDNNYSPDLDKKKIKEIAVFPRDFDTTDPDDLLTIDEIMKLLEACRQARDRALISTLYESGVRIGELSLCQWNDLFFDEYGVKMNIRDEKEQQKRNTRLVKLAPAYLGQWKDLYERETGMKPEGSNRVFLTAQNRPIEYPTVKALLQRLRERAKIEKRIHPHLFRKSRITHMIVQGYKESTVKELMWKNQNSMEFKTYLRLSGMNIEEDILEKEGIQVNKKSVPKIPDKLVCGNCFSDNGPTAKYCYKCGHGLTKETSVEKKSAEDEIHADPKYQAWKAQLVKDLGLEKLNQ